MSFQIDFPAQPRFPILAPDGTASAPSYSFGSQPSIGFYRNGTGQVSLGVGGARGLTFSQGVIDILADAGLLRFGASVDTVLTRDAADTLGLRRGTNAQTFNLYGTYTDASNYERGFVRWNTNSFEVGTEKAGTGSARAFGLVTDGSVRWYIGSTSGHFLANNDNTYDIGAGANRPRNIYAGTSVVTALLTSTGNVLAGSTSNIGWTGRSQMYTGGDGRIVLSNAAFTDFSRLQFGGTTSSFPALRRSGTSIEAVLADNSAYTGFNADSINADSITAAANRTMTAGGIAGVGFKLSTTVNFGVFFGSGFPGLVAAKGSLYLRSDGSGPGNRMYVATDSVGGWTAVTTST